MTKTISYHELFVLATPIGNLQEANPLLINTLNHLKTIFCEDTRVTKKLLDLLNIKQPIELFSFHKFNEHDKLKMVKEKLLSNDCGLISDAGYPTICDPGYALINFCHQNKIKVNVINGTSAIMHAIVQSGFCSNGFIFIGFIEKKEQDFKNQLDHYLENNTLPIVSYVSVHQITKTITWLKKYYSDYEIYLGRELTKKFETYYVGLVKDFNEIILKGEFCLIIKPQIKTNDVLDEHQIINELNLLQTCDIKINDACKYLAKKLNLNKNELYKLYLDYKNKH